MEKKNYLGKELPRKRVEHREGELPAQVFSRFIKHLKVKFANYSDGDFEKQMEDYLGEARISLITFIKEDKSLNEDRKNSILSSIFEVENPQANVLKIYRNALNNILIEKVYEKAFGQRGSGIEIKEDGVVKVVSFNDYVDARTNVLEHQANNAGKPASFVDLPRAIEIRLDEETDVKKTEPLKKIIEDWNDSTGINIYSPDVENYQTYLRWAGCIFDSIEGEHIVCPTDDKRLRNYFRDFVWPVLGKVAEKEVYTKGSDGLFRKSLVYRDVTFYLPPSDGNVYSVTELCGRLMGAAFNSATLTFNDPAMKTVEKRFEEVNSHRRDNPQILDMTGRIGVKSWMDIVMAGYDTGLIAFRNVLDSVHAHQIAKRLGSDSEKSDFDKEIIEGLKLFFSRAIRFSFRTDLSYIKEEEVSGLIEGYLAIISSGVDMFELIRNEKSKNWGAVVNEEKINQLEKLRRQYPILLSEIPVSKDILFDIIDRIIVTPSLVQLIEKNTITELDFASQRAQVIPLRLARLHLELFGIIEGLQSLSYFVDEGSFKADRVEKFINMSLEGAPIPDTVTTGCPAIPGGIISNQLKLYLKLFNTISGG